MLIEVGVKQQENESKFNLEIYAWLSSDNKISKCRFDILTNF